MLFKIKIFIRFLNRRVLLTKDNLVKRRWTGCKKCVFSDIDESIKHTFISCQLARQILRLIHFTLALLHQLRITLPTSVTNLLVIGSMG